MSEDNKNKSTVNKKTTTTSANKTVKTTVKKTTPSSVDKTVEKKVTENKPIEQKTDTKKIKKPKIKKVKPPKVKKIKKPKIKKVKPPKVKKIKKPKVKKEGPSFFNQKIKQISPMWSLITFASLLMSISIERNILLNISNNSMADKVFTFLFFFIGFGALVFTLTGIFGNLKYSKEVIKNPNESWPLALNFASTALVGSIIISRWSNSLTDFQWYFGNIFWWLGYVGVFAFFAYWVYTAFFSFNIKEVNATWLVPSSLLAICFINSQSFINEFKLFAEINWILAAVTTLLLFVLVMYRYIYINHEKNEKFYSIGFISLAPAALLSSEMYVYTNTILSADSQPILPFILFGFVVFGLFLSYMTFIKNLITKKQSQKIVYYSVFILMSSIALKDFALSLENLNIYKTLSDQIKIFWNVNLGIGATIYGISIIWIFTITIHLFLYEGEDQNNTKNKIMKYLLTV